MALELRDRAVANGVCFPWLTYDEGYGRIPEFHLELDLRGQRNVGEVPCNFCGWCKRPQPLHKKHHLHSGRKLKVKNLPASRVDDSARCSAAFTGQPWQDFYIKDSPKGPII